MKANHDSSWTAVAVENYPCYHPLDQILHLVLHLELPMSAHGSPELRSVLGHLCRRWICLGADIGFHRVC